MNRRQWAACVIGLGLMGLGAAPQKGPLFNVRNLIGVWKFEVQESICMEFRADGKAASYALVDGKKQTETVGTFKLSGDKLTTSLVDAGQTITETFTLVTLTPDSLIFKNDAGGLAKFKKSK